MNAEKNNKDIVFDTPQMRGVRRQSSQYPVAEVKNMRLTLLADFAGLVMDFADYANGFAE